jgi:organic radical activating enzyme
MNKFSSVITRLESKYNIDGPIDISVFFEQNGSKKLYEIINNHYKETYNPHDRLVLYFDTDLYIYDNQPGKLISTLQQYISDIDISHCFILIISSNKQPKYDLETTCDIYSTDPNPIKHIQCSDVPVKTTHDTLNNNTLCIKPWIHLYAGTDGNILPCCSADTTMPISTVKLLPDIDAMYNTKGFKQIRKSMLSNKRPIECAKCYELELSGIESNRTKANKQWQDKLNVVKPTNEDGSIDNVSFASIDFRISNTCNFKCRICTGYTSSKIQAEELKNNITNVQYITLTSNERKTTLESILPALYNVEEVYFAGGEPILIKEHYQILDELIKQNKQNNVRLRYNSNLSVLGYKGTSIIEYWKKFNNIQLGISIDDINKPAEYARSGTIWPTIEDNYKIITRQCPHIKIDVTSTFSIYNAFNLTKLQHLWITSGKINARNLSLELLTTPNYISVQLLPKPYKEKLTVLITEHINFLKAYNCTQLIELWNKAMIFLNASDRSFDLHKFFKYNDALDKCRDESFEQIYPEYINLRKHS